MLLLGDIQTSTAEASTPLTHGDRVTRICLSKLTTIGWDNGLSPGRRQAIISTNDGILLIGPWEQTSVKSFHVHLKLCILNCRQEIGGYFVVVWMC